MKPAHGTRPTAVDSTEKKEAADTGPNPESGDEAVGAGGTALDTSRSSAITDHPFEPREDAPYLCAGPIVDGLRLWACNLAEAAHAETTAQRDPEELPYRCSRCVEKGTSPCTHAPEVVDGFIREMRDAKEAS